MSIDRRRDAGQEHDAPAASAGRPSCRSALEQPAPASPPSTASGGSTNTKWRMPLYIAGRAITVDGDRQHGGEREQQQDCARRDAGELAPERRDERAGNAAACRAAARSPAA